MIVAAMVCGCAGSPVEKTSLGPARTDLPTGCPPELHVASNRLETAAGKVVWLQGLAIASMEWLAGGEHVLQSVAVGIDQWKANCIRLPVKDDFWFGRGKGQTDGGEAYRKLVDAVVEATASRGAYLALDLHRFGAPTDEHVAFWKDAAARYKNHPAVLFDLFKLNWTAWCFHPRASPVAISDWNYTPTPYWGAYVKEALAGKMFEMKKMR